MKKREWNEGLNNIDPDLVEKYLTQKETLSKNKRTKNIYLRIGVIAACVAFVLCTVLITVFIYKVTNKDNNIDHISGDELDPDINSVKKDGEMDEAEGGKFDDEMPGDMDEVEGDSPSDSVNGDISPNAPIYGETAVGSEVIKETDNDDWSTNIGESLPDYALDIEILEDKYSNYGFIGYMCDAQKIGEELGEITVQIKDGSTEPVFSAKVYSLAGVDSEFALCVKYDSENDYFDDGYHLICAKSFIFTSLDDMRDKLLGDGGLFIQSYANYTVNNKTTEEYCKNFKLSDTLSENLKQYLLELDGLSKLTQDPSAFEEKHDEANEFVTIYCTFAGNVGSITSLMRVYDTGYLYYAPFGGQLFYIDEELAREIIDFVIKQGTPEGYAWNEEEGKWEPIISNEMNSDSFRRALADNKILSQINLLEEVSYQTYVYQPICPAILKLESRYLIALAEILEAADGNAVTLEENIESLADVSLTFFHSWDGGDTCGITVYDSGHIGLYGRYYFVGTKYTDKIINTALLKSTNSVGLYWDRTANEWKEQGENGAETAETHPASGDETMEETEIVYIID